MRLRFVGIDPGTEHDECPAVFVDEESGDFVFIGWTITDPDALSQITANSPIASYETAVRLPARMRELIMKSLEVRDDRKGEPSVR